MNLTVENNEVVISLSLEEQTAANAIAAAQRALNEADRAKSEADRSESERILSEQASAQTQQDAVATAADRIQTGLDREATAADRIQTGLDKVQTGLDRTATGEDRQATALDRIQTALDRVATGLDKQATAQDVITTGENVNASFLNAQNAHQSALNAEQFEQSALMSKNDSETAAQSSLLSKQASEQAASSASASAQNAQQSASEASGSAQTASNASSSAVSAKNASEAARDQSQASASSAASSAQTATSQANTATQQAGIATTKANEANQSAIDANASKIAAEAAETGAETAQVASAQSASESLQYRNEASTIINQGVYGVEWKRTFPTTVCTRVGDMSLHQAITGLPVHNRMRRCLLLDDGTVNYYLDPNDSTKRDDGTDSNLDGTDGQVMVEIPEHCRRFDTDGDIQRVLIAEAPFRGSHRVPKAYVSAFEATVFRPTNLLSSVINTSPDYRGGNNNASWDSEDRSLLGMPATNISRINFLAFARNRGANWHSYLYEIHKTLFWLYTIEYATRNSQLGFNPDLTAEGFRQGGLGAGVTNYSGSAWSSFNSSYPIFQCGMGAMDNFNHSIAVTHPVLGATQITQYRGIEHPFGHIWKWTEGVNLRNGNNISMVYKANSFNFRSSDYQGYEYAGDLGTTSAYIREIRFGRNGDMFASNVSGASSTTFWADYLFQSIPSTGVSLRGLLFGGSANSGARAGFVYSSANNDPSLALTSVGSRLCFAEQMGA
jgi:hypothetical protein